MNKRIGVNIGSMLPLSAIPIVGLSIAAWITRKAGYAFWQILPLRSVSVRSLKRAGGTPGIPVKYMEPAWNATTLLGHIQHRVGSEGMPTLWRDVLFFPSPGECVATYNAVYYAMGGVKQIRHDLRVDRELVEVHPGLDRNASELLGIAQERGKKERGMGGFVLDTKHIRSQRDTTAKKSYTDFLQDFQQLLPYAKLIHVQAWNALEWKRFVNGRSSEMDLLLQEAKAKGFSGDLVVEYPPGSISGRWEWVNPQLLAKSLARIRERLEQILG